MASASTQANLGKILVDFSLNGAFPEEEAVSAASVEPSALSSALVVLQNAKTDLETQVRQISKESAPDVDAWIKHAQGIQDDIARSKQLASQIVRQAEADEERAAALEDAQTYVGFLTKELEFNEHLRQALQEIQKINSQLNQAEILAGESKIMEAMKILAGAWQSISTVPSDTTVRAMKILDQRCFTLRAAIHDQFEVLWKALIVVNMNDRVVTINQTIPAETVHNAPPMSIAEASITLEAYKEVDRVAKQLWEDLDDAILKPRTELRVGTLPKIQIEGNSISIGSQTSDTKIKSLFIELEQVIRFLIDKLTPELIRSLSDAMMPTLSARVKDLWLDNAVSPAISEIESYQKALNQVSEFANILEELDWSHSDGFRSWVENAPKIWLNKRRETILDWTRNQLALGIGHPRPAERVEKKMVERDEGLHITGTANTVNDEWDAAWDSDQEDSPSKENKSLPAISPVAEASGSSPERNRGSMEEERRHSSLSTPAPLEPSEDDDPTEAWGWGDDDAAEEAVVDPEDSEPPATLYPELRQVTLSEKYWTSSTPQPILQAVIGVLNDGATLTQPKNERLPICPAAPGLFNLPTLILAEYRALSPIYYAENTNGNMYLFNDAMWLSGQLQDFVEQWKQRKDVPERAYGMIRLDPEIKNLKSFGNRAYTNELVAQRTIINDLLAGTQNFFHQDKEEIKDGMRFVLKQIRERHAAWVKILPWSACASATGSLVNAVASKLIADIFDLTTIGVDEAEHIATIISNVESLDNLFINPAQQNGKSSSEQPSLAAQFVEKWLKMGFLNEVLQSNLAEIKFLWNESELSYYFTVDEVVDLIRLSFENNHNVRQTIKEIQSNPLPKGLLTDGAS